MKFQLGEDQVNAIKAIKTFLKSKEIAISISGYAGTGKSTITKEIVHYLEDINVEYVLCAPTHIAKLVLEQFADREGITLHKLLSLTPNIEILNLDFKDLKFYMNNKTTLFPTRGVIICDEASMVNDELFDLLLMKCKEYNSKIIFSGDRAQLKPVTALTHSKVFNLPNCVMLTKIYRQSKESGLVNILPILRTNVIPRFKDSLGSEGSLTCHSDMKDFFSKIIPSFRKAIRDGDILESKILAYTNERVNIFNKKTKEILFGIDKEYNQFEFLTCYENLEFNGFNFWNSMNYIIIDEPTKTDINIPNFMSLPGYKLNLYDSANKVSEEVSILSRDTPKDYLDSLCYTIESIRLEAIELKRRRSPQSSKKWREYYAIINSFASPADLYFDNRLIRKKSFDYGYASTVHRSQGQSINNVFIDMKNISLCRDRDEWRQLQYVSVSRAKNNVYIYQ